MEKLSELKFKAEQELTRILDWWGYRMVDNKDGGFYGRVNGHGLVVPDSPKGVILNARILWTFSAAARHGQSPFYVHLAERSKHYFINHFVDPEYGGVFWTLDSLGQPLDTKKQIYAQAFAIYALSEYYLLTNDPEAWTLCQHLFTLIETHSSDHFEGGYLEGFNRRWGPIEDLRLSAKDLNAAKTMNTHLHVLEAYTNLFRSKPQDQVGEALYKIIHLFLDKFMNQENEHLNLFFDQHWTLLSNEISFGHDIETSWLLVEAAEALDDQDLIEKCKGTALALADATLTAYDEDGGLFNSATPEGLKDKAKEWWPQIEAVVGFIQAWHISSEPIYLQAALQSWSFIENKLIDHQNGEWYWGLDAQGRPDVLNDKAGLWKCPYHNSRGCLEVIKRLS